MGLLDQLFGLQGEPDGWAQKMQAQMQSGMISPSPTMYGAERAMPGSTPPQAGMRKMFPAPDAPKEADAAPRMNLGGPTAAAVEAPGVGTYLKGALSGFGGAGGGSGILGAIGGAMNAGDQVDKQNELYQTLVAGNIDPKTAQLMIKQPEALKVILANQEKKRAEKAASQVVPWLMKRHGMDEQTAAAIASNPAYLQPYLKPDDPNADLSRRKTEAEIAKLEQETKDGGKSAQRLTELEKLGIDPNSAEGIIFQANGKLPESASKEIIGRQQKAKAGPQVARGLENLRKMAEGYDQTSLESAIGPWQGADPDTTGLLSAPVANVARGLGEVWNTVAGGKNNLSEVRSNIRGTTEALAAAIKPLIRGPGEGVWTDADQARLVAVVGDLSQASTKEEFMRRLNSVRDRIQSNFDIEVPFEAMQDAAKPDAAPDVGGKSTQDLRAFIRGAK